MTNIKPHCKVITCINKDYAIGRGNQLIYKIPEDLNFFKKTTMNKSVVVGRLTYESLPPTKLPGRDIIIMTHQKGYKVEDCVNVEVANSVDDVFKILSERGVLEFYVIGGEQIYRLFEPYFHEMYVTYVDDAIQKGDAFFPIDLKKYKMIKENPHEYHGLKYYRRWYIHE